MALCQPGYSAEHRVSEFVAVSFLIPCTVFLAVLVQICLASNGSLFGRTGCVRVKVPGSMNGELYTGKLVKKLHKINKAHAASKRQSRQGGDKKGGRQGIRA